MRHDPTPLLLRFPNTPHPTALLQRNNEEILLLRDTHQTEIKRVSSQLDLSTEKLQKVQSDEMRQKQLQMRIEELQSDLERSERENAEKVSGSFMKEMSLSPD